MPKKIIKILSIDGGGMKGIIPAVVLAEIEHRTGKLCSELFDLISGTSAGSIVALGLAVPGEDGKPKCSAQQVVELMETRGAEIFSRSLWHTITAAGNIRSSKYPPDGLVNVMKDVGKDHRLSEMLTEVLIPAYDIESGNPYFFKRWEAKKDPRKDFFAYEAVCASSAAPTYFNPYIIKAHPDDTVKHYAFIDGCMVANNPSMCAYVEAKSLFPDADEYLVISLGTGEGSSQMLYELFNQWGAIHWVMPLIDILMGGSTEMVDHQLKTLFHTKGDNLNHYYRFQTRITDPVQIDEVSGMGVHKIKLMGENIIIDNTKMLDELCAKLTA